MKLRIIISVIIFVVISVWFIGTAEIGIDHIKLIDMPWNSERIWLTGFMLIAAGTFAALPFAPDILKYVFRRRA